MTSRFVQNRAMKEKRICKMHIGDVEISIDMRLLNESAEEIFMDISGLSEKSGKKLQRMKDASFGIRREIYEKINIVAECRLYENIQLDGCVLTVDGTELSCRAFSLLEQDMLEGAYLYVISAGDFSLPEAKAIERLYADLWGNAYADALRSMMKDELEKISPISDSFGPGFYGMETGELTKLSWLLDFEGKGISVKNEGLMVPLKSCAGIIFKVNENYKKLNAACEKCMGNQKSCGMCIVNGSR